jgi:hypothetical protein
MNLKAHAIFVHILVDAILHTCYKWKTKINNKQ